MKIQNLIPLICFPFSVGCDALLENVETFTCSVVPYYAADCLDPAVQEKTVSVLTNGAVESQINCNGIATTPLGTPPRVANVVYSATRLQDGACFSTVNVTLTGSNAFGVSLVPRSMPDVEHCPVTAVQGPGLAATVTIQDGLITVNSPLCQSGPGVFCTMPVEGNCTGLNVEKF